MRMFKMPNVHLELLKANGTIIETKSYGKLVDFEAGCWANVLGHGRKELIKEIHDHGSNLFHTHHYFETVHPKALVNEICAAANLESKYDGTFLSSGSDAVSLAVLLSEVLTGRTKKLCFSLSYLSTTPELRLPRNQNLWLDLNIAECLKCNKDCSKCSLVNTIDYSDFASFVFEPGNSGGQVLCPPDQLISYLASQIWKAGGLVIANEVTTGFGRTGKWFGFQHYSVLNQRGHTPDLIAMGKGLGNGYPISGVLVRSRWAKEIEKTNFHYVQSHIDDPLGCIIARKVVEIMRSENAVEKSRFTGEIFRDKLQDIQKRTGQIIEVRGRGLMIAIKLADNINAIDVFNALLNAGYFVGCSEAANLLRFYPSLLISHEEINAVCDKIEQLLNSIN